MHKFMKHVAAVVVTAVVLGLGFAGNAEAVTGKPPIPKFCDVGELDCQPNPNPGSAWRTFIADADVVNNWVSDHGGAYFAIAYNPADWESWMTFINAVESWALVHAGVIPGNPGVNCEYYAADRVTPTSYVDGALIRCMN